MADLLTKLPIEIIFDILSRLPLRTISNCRWVSKSWYDFILNPNFAQLHFSKFKHDFPCAIFPSRYQESYLIDPESLSRYESFATAYQLNLKNFREIFTILNGWNFEVVGTVNGLVCFSPENCDYEPTPYYVVNPITRDYVLLPKSPKIVLEPVGSGFGFDSIKDEYKLVRILQNTEIIQSEEEEEYENPKKKCKKDGNGEDEMKDRKYGNVVEIYTLGSGSWREVQLTTDVPCFTVRGMMRQSNVCVNGCLHWTPLVDIDSKEYDTIILSFDLSKEEFNLIQMPPIKNRGELETFELIVLCEQLCLVDGEFMGDKDVWVMKSYGVHSSWVKEYVFKEEVISCGWHGFHEVMELKNNELLLVNKNLKLSYYDRKNMISKPIMLHDLEGNEVKVETDLAVYLQGSILSPRAIECIQ